MWCIAACIASVAYGQVPSARDAAPVVSPAIVGTVFDSISQRPLGGAHVHLADLARDVVADARGAFRFDSVSAGAHTVWADHPTLDQLGLYSIAAPVEIGPLAPVAGVALAVPSFATLWQRACAGVPAPPPGEGFIFGRVRDAANGAGALSVVIAWRAAAGAPADAQRTATVDRDGTYALCGIPNQQAVTISASGSAASTVPVTLRIGDERIARRDITLPTAGAIEQALADASVTAPVARLPRGTGATVTGIVKDSAGRPLEDARITISGVTGEWRTNYDGAFVARGIPAGTHVAESRALGFEPDQRVIDLASTDSSHLDLSMSRLITRLSTVTVREREHFNEIKAELDQRRRMGFGYRTDSLELDHLPGLDAAFAFPGVHVSWKPKGWKIYMTGVKSLTRTNGNQGLCEANVYIDGQPLLLSGKSLIEMHKEEVAMIEIYNSASRAPLQFPSDNNCGVVLVWTKMYVNPPR
jgi:hypothetical protein